MNILSIYSTHNKPQMSSKKLSSPSQEPYSNPIPTAEKHEYAEIDERMVSEIGINWLMLIGNNICQSFDTVYGWLRNTSKSNLAARGNTFRCRIFRFIGVDRCYRNAYHDWWFVIGCWRHSEADVCRAQVLAETSLINAEKMPRALISAPSLTSSLLNAIRPFLMTLANKYSLYELTPLTILYYCQALSIKVSTSVTSNISIVSGVYGFKGELHFC